MTPVRLWLDDVRYPPSDDWTWVKTVEQAIALLEAGEVVEMSLDNDLHPFVHDGTEVCDWMLEHDIWPDVIHVHTSNTFAARYMCGVIKKSGFQQEPGRLRSFRRKGAEQKA